MRKETEGTAAKTHTLSFNILHSAVCLPFFFIAFVASFFLLRGGKYVVMSSFFMAGALFVPASTVMFWLRKFGWAFFLSLAAAVLISYAGFFLLTRENILFSLGEVAGKHFSSFSLPLLTGIAWMFLREKKAEIF